MSRLRVAEFFCGLGGCAAALGNNGQVVAAIDINQNALAVYAHNFTHFVVNREIESLPLSLCDSWKAQLWWLSPPCQPYTTKGKQRDLADPRARSLVSLVRLAEQLRPRYLALENVPGFIGSQAHLWVRETLSRAGYMLAEHTLCPTLFGWPSRRPRFYLVAALEPLRELNSRPHRRRPLSDFVDDETSPEFAIAPEVAAKYQASLHCLSASAAEAETRCFTSAYGRSWYAAGSYLTTRGGLRFFTPRELARLLGFPPTFSLPAGMAHRTAWSLLGNSLSVPVVRRVLSTIPELLTSAAQE